MESFEILQIKKSSSQIKAIDAAVCMDLIAILTEDGSLSVIRTISWEIVLQLSKEELCDSTIEHILFSSDGDIILAGSNILIARVETGFKIV